MRHASFFVTKVLRTRRLAHEGPADTKGFATKTKAKDVLLTKNNKNRKKEAGARKDE